MKRAGYWPLSLILTAVLLLPLCKPAMMQTARKLGPGRLYSSVERMDTEHLKAVNHDRIYSRSAKTLGDT